MKNKLAVLITTSSIICLALSNVFAEEILTKALYIAKKGSLLKLNQGKVITINAYTESKHCRTPVYFKWKFIDDDLNDLEEEKQGPIISLGVTSGTKKYRMLGEKKKFESLYSDKTTMSYRKRHKNRHLNVCIYRVRMQNIKPFYNFENKKVKVMIWAESEGVTSKKQEVTIISKQKPKNKKDKE